jgi:Bacterial PH domain
MSGPLVFRISPLGLIAVVTLAVCVMPVAVTAPGALVLFGIPIGLLCWIVRVRTTVDADTVAVRGILRTRRVAWTDITALRLRTRSRVSAVLTNGAELPLPAVHVRDLPLLASVSGGRLPDPSAVSPKE